MPSIMVGQHGTLQFVPAMAGLDPTTVASSSFQPQGAQQAVKFTPPNKVEGQAVGNTKFKCTVKLTQQVGGGNVPYDFQVDCYEPMPAGPPAMAPVSILIESPPVPPPPA